MRYDVIVVGAGIAGLSASAYLSKEGYRILLCEKEDHTGGLVSTFERDGFRYDGGIRAIESSGVMFPMLSDLGIDVPLVKSEVSIGIGQDIIDLDRTDSIDEYQRLLEKHFKTDEKDEDIDRIVAEMRKTMRYMDVLYGIDNPAFMNPGRNREYLVKTLLPWLLKFPLAMRKISRCNTPVDEYLNRISQNQPLIDFIIQHFFKKIPAFFALSYFRLYQDYHYPLGGTGSLPDAIALFGIDHGLELRLNTAISSIQVDSHCVVCATGESISYRNLLWAADSKCLYNAVDLSSVKCEKTRGRIEAYRQKLRPLRGGDSIFTLYCGVDLEPSYFASISNGHFFYTPETTGLSKADSTEIDRLVATYNRGSGTIDDVENAKKSIRKWLRSYFELNTYEISIPSIRDASMSPRGKTGLIVSTLFNYEVFELVRAMNWYDDFKQECENTIIQILVESIYPKIGGKIVHQFSVTPLTIARTAGTSDGAITGWAFTNEVIPAESRFLRIFSSTRTSIPDVRQAGQWTFTPSGLPIAALTGKLAADAINKRLG